MEHLDWILSRSKDFQGAMLGRLESDLNYYNNFHRNTESGENVLYFKELKKHTQAIEALKKNLGLK